MNKQTYKQTKKSIVLSALDRAVATSLSESNRIFILNNFHLFLKAIFSCVLERRKYIWCFPNCSVTPPICPHMNEV